MDEKKVEKTVETTEVARQIDPARVTKPLDYYERARPAAGVNSNAVDRASGWSGQWARGSFGGGGRER